MEKLKEYVEEMRERVKAKEDEYDFRPEDLTNVQQTDEICVILHNATIAFLKGNFQKGILYILDSNASDEEKIGMVILFTRSYERYANALIIEGMENMIGHIIFGGGLADIMPKVEEALEDMSKDVKE